jgi:hypothetical protein
VPTVSVAFFGTGVMIDPETRFLLRRLREKTETESAAAYIEFLYSGDKLVPAVVQELARAALDAPSERARSAVIWEILFHR